MSQVLKFIARFVSFIFRPLMIIAIILGVAIIRDFDFNTLTFENTWLDALYFVVFVAAVILLVREQVKK